MISFTFSFIYLLVFLDFKLFLIFSQVFNIYFPLIFCFLFSIYMLHFYFVWFSYILWILFIFFSSDSNLKKKNAFLLLLLFFPNFYLFLFSISIYLHRFSQSWLVIRIYEFFMFNLFNLFYPFKILLKSI